MIHMIRGFSYLIPVTKKLDKTFLMSKMITTVNKFVEYEGSFYLVVKFVEMTLPCPPSISFQPPTTYLLPHDQYPNSEIKTPYT